MGDIKKKKKKERKEVIARIGEIGNFVYCLEFKCCNCYRK